MAANGDSADLVRHLAALPGLDRIRYTTSHPGDVDDELIAAHRDVPQLMPFLHLPVQSGSDAILAAMNRRHTVGDYRRVVERLRLARPDLALSTDLIVGFPGESDADFRATLQLVDEIGFAQAFSFKYSARPGTPAASARRQIPEPVKTDDRAPCRRCSRRSSAISTGPASGASCRYCSKSRAVTSGCGPPRVKSRLRAHRTTGGDTAPLQHGAR